MERIHRPARAALAAFVGKEFEDERDTAVIALFAYTGMRRTELFARVVPVLAHDRVGVAAHRTFTVLSSGTSRAADRG